MLLRLAYTVMNYYRITAYHPDEDISVILDSNGRFDALWEFSVFLIEKGFKIIEVARDDGFDPGTLAKTAATPRITLRAIQADRPKLSLTERNGKRYKEITVAKHHYLITT